MGPAIYFSRKGFWRMACSRSRPDVSSVEMDNVIPFPRMGAVRKPQIMGGLALSRPAPPPPAEMEHFKSDEVQRLSAVADEVYRQGIALVGWVDEDRPRARAVGVETVAIELGALVESDGFMRMKDALAAARRDREECQLSSSGLDRLRRGERLWHEAQSQLRRKGLPEASFRSPALGAGTSASSETSPLTALIILGGIAIGAVLLVSLFGGGR